MTPGRAARLRALAAAHETWETEWLPRAPYAPPSRLPAGSVLNLHYLDVDPPAGAEAAFQALAGVGAEVSAAWAAWEESKHPRVPGGHGGGEFTHTPGVPGAPSDLEPGRRAYYPMARGDIQRRIGEELAAQMPQWRYELHQWAKPGSAPVGQIHSLGQMPDHGLMSQIAKEIEGGKEPRTPVAVHDTQTGRYYILSGIDEAEAYRHAGRSQVPLMVLTPKVAKVERGHKAGGGLKRDSVDTWFRWGIAHWDDLKPETRRHLEAGRAAFKKNTAEGDTSAIASIRLAAASEQRVEATVNVKRANQLTAYADKLAAAQAPRPGASGVPKLDGGKIDRGELFHWLGAIRTDPDVVSSVQNAAMRAQIALGEGNDEEAGLALLRAAGIAEDTGQKDLGRHMRETGQALSRAHAEAHKDDLRLTQINKDAGQAVLDIRGHVGDIIGTPESRFHGVIKGGGKSRRVNGTMGWDGVMTLNRDRVSKAMEDLAAGRPTSADGFRTVVHELVHAAGEGRADPYWYGYTTGAKEMEEGFTELGSRLIVSDVADRMGWGERPAKGSMGLTLADRLARYGETSGLRQGMGTGTYHSYVATAWAWCEDVAKAEGLMGPALNRRARQLAIEVAGANTQNKTPLMAEMFLKARGVDPGEMVKTKGAGNKTALAVTVAAIQKTWASSSKKQVAPIGPVLSALAADGVQL